MTVCINRSVMMRLGIPILIMIFFSFGRLEAQDDHVVNWEYKDLAFSDFVKKAENTLHVRFFYREEWISDLKLGFYGDNITLGTLLDNLFRGLSMYYFIDSSGNVVITKNFAVKIAYDQVADSLLFIPSDQFYETDEKGVQSANMMVELGNPAEKDRPGNVVISGYITDRDTRDPVSGATVFVSKLGTGTLSNQYGFYSLTLPRGNHLVQFTFVGMKEKRVDLKLYGSGEMNIEMNSTLIPLKETIVSAQKDITMQRFEAGVEKVNISAFKSMPTSMGESDIINSFLQLPGVHSVGEGAAGLNVRGGSAGQNLILLYGAPLYNSNHLFGFFPAVNSDILKDVTLYKGGMPARYGGRISSILDIESKDGSRREFTGNAGISPVTTHVMIEGPVKKDTLFYIFTGRTTYSDWAMKIFDNPILDKSKASFYDLNGKITYDLAKKDKIDLSSYFSHDAFRFNSDTTYSYSNSIISLRWQHFYSSRFFSVLTLNNSRYNYDISGEKSSADGFILSHFINSTGFKADFNLYQGAHELNFGFDGTRYSVLPGKIIPSSDSSLVLPKTIRKEKAYESAVYLEDQFMLNEKISVSGGIRLSAFFALGPQSFYIYDPAYPKRLSSVTDTVTFGAGNIYKVWGGPEYRVSLNFRPTAGQSFKLNYNRTRQYLHLMSNSTSVSPTDIWKLSDYYIKPEICDQYAFGYYLTTGKGKLGTSVELYYKNLRNVFDFKGGTRIIMDDHIEKNLIYTKGKAYGLEVMIKKETGRLRYSLGYGYSRTLLRSISNLPDEIINGGKWFPANYDKPHDLVLSFNYLSSRRLTLSGNYIYTTGRPITYPVSSYKWGDIILVHYSDRNKYRIPDYMRLDLSLRISGNLKSKKIIHPYYTFSVYNILGRDNVYSIYFRNENDRLMGYKLSVFGNAIPSVTISFDFK